MGLTFFWAVDEEDKELAFGSSTEEERVGCKGRASNNIAVDISKTLLRISQTILDRQPVRPDARSPL